MERVHFSEIAQKTLDIMIDYHRLGILLPDDATKGPRFINDEAILARLESNYTEAEFMACPGLTIDKMLIDAAQADRWYEVEKRYDDDYCLADETEIVDRDE